MLSLKFFREYTLDDGRYIVTPCDLTYAHDPRSTIVKVALIRQEDLMQSAILPNAYLAETVKKLLSGKDWKPAELVLTTQRSTHDHTPIDYCLMSNYSLYLYSGNGHYAPIDECVRGANKLELELMLRNVAGYAALLQAAMAQQSNANVEKAN